MNLKNLTRIRHYAAKEAMDIYDIAEQSQEVARDTRYGPLHASRGRTVYMPEVGQRAYAILRDWKEDPEGRLALAITFKKRNQYINATFSVLYK